ncbi:MAG: hypothetical protein SGJ19_13960 [Planctomycetia bacterium]|nr:hypothetical protein [Planctomycetia bacterium]
MTSRSCLWSSALVSGLLFAGCAKPAAPTAADTATSGTATTAESASAEPVDEVTKAIKELPEAEQAAALAQKWCPVAAMDGHDNLLGSMGMPHKVTLDGKDVYLCCEGCVATAEKDPAATLGKVEELTQRAATETK